MTPTMTSTIQDTTRNAITAGAAFSIHIPAAYRSNNGTGPAGYRYRVDSHLGNDRFAPALFAKVWSGRQWVYIGKLNDFTGQVETTPASKLPANNAAVKLLNRVLARVWCDDQQAFQQFGFQIGF